MNKNKTNIFTYIPYYNKNYKNSSLNKTWIKSGTASSVTVTITKIFLIFFFKKISINV